MGAATLIFSGGATSAGQPEPKPLPRELQRTLRVGQSIRFDENLWVTFVKVSSDSRCPMNARCIWAGDAEVVLFVKVGLRPPEVVTLHTNEDPRNVVLSALPDGMVGIPKSYIMTLRQLTPQPVTWHQLSQREYRLTLGFSTAL